MDRVHIIGGGIIGLLTARELVSAGVQVTLIDRQHCGKEASWAGGGIVSPLYPWRYNAAVTQLASWAQEAYPQLCASLLEETGIDPEFNTCGLLMLHADDEAQALQWATDNQREMHQVNEPFLYQKESYLGPGFFHGLWMPGVANVRNPRLLKSLKQALVEKGVEFLEDQQVEAIKLKQEQVHAIQTDKTELKVESVIVAAGAWSQALLEPFGLSLPVEPVRGQMLLIRAEPNLLHSIILSQGKYIIPRRDGHIVVGSTLEHVGFDKSITHAAEQQLSDAAYRMMPELREYPIVAQWAGLRPGAPDGVPYIGGVPGIRNLFVNAGHFRNGLVLAPASARLMADLLLERETAIDSAPYSLSRLLA